MDTLAMELRAVDADERTVTAVVAPYDEVSYLTRDPAGERIIRGAFAKSIAQAGRKIQLRAGHDPNPAAVGHAVSWDEDESGLTGTFALSRSRRGDEVLEELREDNYGGVSVEFLPLQHTRGKDGVREVREARLFAAALVGMPAYENARIVAVRAKSLDEWLVPFLNRPVVDLSPVPAVWLYDSAR